MKNNKVKVLIGVLILIVSIVYYNGYVYLPMYYDGDFFIGEYVFRDTHKGDIIGNPDFIPSFIEVKKDNFREKYLDNASKMGFSHEVEILNEEEKKSFSQVFMIQNKFKLNYDEGFIILNAEFFVEDPMTFNEILKVLLITLDPDYDMNSYIEFLDNGNHDFEDYNNINLSSKVDFRFYDDEGILQLHIEDLRMGH